MEIYCSKHESKIAHGIYTPPGARILFWCSDCALYDDILSKKMRDSKEFVVRLDEFWYQHKNKKYEIKPENRQKQKEMIAEFEKEHAALTKDLDDKQMEFNELLKGIRDRTHAEKDFFDKKWTAFEDKNTELQKEAYQSIPYLLKKLMPPNDPKTLKGSIILLHWYSETVDLEIEKNSTSYEDSLKSSIDTINSNFQFSLLLNIILELKGMLANVNLLPAAL